MQKKTLKLKVSMYSCLAGYIKITPMFQTLGEEFLFVLYSYPNLNLRCTGSHRKFWTYILVSSLHMYQVKNPNKDLAALD